jgi:ethanolamine utilization microcompartment shell protein EutS
MAWLAEEEDGRIDLLADLTADPAVDLVISANLMSHLAGPVEDWLDDHPARKEKLPADLPTQCIAWHLADLRRFGGRVVLLSDVETVERDRAGAITDRLDLTRGIALPAR